MRRFALTALVVAVGLATVLPASSATPTVGGPKKSSMAFSLTATGPQQHVLAETYGDTAVDSDPTDDSNPHCEKPRCYAFPFAVAPLTKGAKSVPVSAQITWASPSSRFWLVLMDMTKDPTVVGECYSWYASAGPSATVEARLPTGHKYAVWVTVQQVVMPSEEVKGVLHSPASDKAPTTPLTSLPAPAPHVLYDVCEG